MVWIEACRRLSRTVVSSAPRASACVACVWRIQCGLARRSLSAVIGLSASITSATFRKKRRKMLHSLAVVMLAALSGLMLPINGVRGSHFVGVIGNWRCMR